jgi:hypothetical protein
MSIRAVLTTGGIALILGLRVLFFFAQFTAKAGVISKKWQLWLLGEPRNSKPPHPDRIVM